MSVEPGAVHESLPFRLDRGGDLERFRAALQKADYIEESVSKTVHTDESGKPVRLAAMLRRTADLSPQNALIRLFVLARSVPEEAVRPALAPDCVDELIDVGLLQRCGPDLRARAALLPFERWYLVRDFWPDFTGGTMPRDYVPGMAPLSRAVANMTVHRPGELALDLGTGSGVQALFVASCHQRVIGTDINPRALNFAAFNARLNGIGNLEVRQGSLLEPVSDCRFDLIVANPPFVMSPDVQCEYRDGGLQGDTLTEQVIRGIPTLLKEGAFATIVGNWHHQQEDDWAERPKQWLESSGCDAWILCSDTRDTLAYAVAWLPRKESEDVDAYARHLDRYLAYYEGLGIRLVSSGAVILRRRSGGPNWLRSERVLADTPRGSCSDQIQRVFAAETLLRQVDDPRQLLPWRFELTADHQLEHVMQAKDGKWCVEAAHLRQTVGFPFVGNVDRWVSTVLAGCDGQHTLSELVADLARGLKADPEKVASACVEIVRTMLVNGFLTVASPP